MRSLRWMESFLETLISYGFDDPAAVAAYRAYTTCLVGHLLLEVSTHGARVHPDEALLEEADAGQWNSSDYPHLCRLQAILSQDHSATEFDESLTALFDRLELLVRH